MDVVEVDLSPGLLAGSTTLPYTPTPLSGEAGTMSMTTIRKTYKQNIYYDWLSVWFAGRTNDLPAIFHNVTVVAITAHRVGGMHIKRLFYT